MLIHLADAKGTLQKNELIECLIVQKVWVDNIFVMK